MDLEQLRTLATVVDEGTFDRAASVLHVSAPAVSQRIKALEAQTGHVLVRRNLPVTVTEPGRTVLRLARQVLDLRAAAHAELGMTAEGGSARAELRLAINADSLATWFRPVLAELGTGEEAMTLRLHYEDQDHSRELLHAGEVAAAITASDRPVAGCRAVSLGRMTYDPVIAPALLERHGPRPDLGRLPVVSFDDKDDLHTEQLHRAGVATGAGAGPPEHRVPSSEAYVRAVADGIGWGMVPRLQLPGAPFAATRHPLQRLDGLGSAVVPLHLQRWATALPALDRLEEVLRARAPQWLAS